MLISGAAFAIVHASVKALPHLPAYELLFIRAVISSSISYLALRRAKIPPFGNNKKMLVLRGLFGTAALLTYFYTLQHMPLATAVTVQYLHPIFTVLLAMSLVGEAPRFWQWLLFGVSFAGVLLVEGLDQQVSILNLAIGITSAFFSACAYNMIRLSRHEDHVLVVVFYLPLVNLMVTAPLSLWKWVPPRPEDWLLLLVIGIFTQVAQYFMTVAYQRERAANISNLNYLGIIYAMAIGVLIFNEEVTLLAIIGMILIGASAALSTRTSSSY